MTRILLRLGRLVSIVCLVFAGRSVLAQTVSNPTPLDFQIETFVLSNGLQVVVMPSNRAPIVTQMLLYRVGSADEESGKSGLAHFLEHLLFKATKNYPVGFYDQQIHRVGGQMNAFTTQDYTVYHQTVASNFLELIMQLEADRMENLIIEEPGFSAEKQVVREEIRQNHIDPPSSQLYSMMQAVLFLHHPYGRPVIGWDHEVNQLTAQDALEFYQRWYTPNNAILMIIGDVKTDQVRLLANKYYGHIPAKSNLKPLNRLSDPPLNMPRRIDFNSEKNQDFRWQRFYKIEFAKKTDSIPSELLAEILGGNSNSRLYKRLVIEDKLASSVSAYLDTSYRDYAVFSIYVTALRKENYDKIEQIINQEIDTIKKIPVTQEEIQRAQTSLDNAIIKARDDLTNLSEYVLIGLATGWQLNDLQTWSTKMRMIDAKTIQLHAQEFLKLENAVTGTLSPKLTVE